MADAPQGFVGVLRRFFASARWVTGEPMHRGARLLDLLQMAAHRDGRKVKLHVGRQAVELTIQRGEFVVGSRHLAERWGIDRRQVRRDLTGWIADGTLESVPANVPANVPAKPVVYRFVNYGTYQPSGGPAVPRVSPQVSPIVERNKNEKKKVKVKDLAPAAQGDDVVRPTTRATWVTPYLEAYAARNAGILPRTGPYLRAISGIQRATGHPHERILRAWCDYLSDHFGRKWCSPFHFAEHYAEHDPDVPVVGDHGQLTSAGRALLRRLRPER